MFFFAFAGGLFGKNFLCYSSESPMDQKRLVCPCCELLFFSSTGFSSSSFGCGEAEPSVPIRAYNWASEMTFTPSFSAFCALAGPIASPATR